MKKQETKNEFNEYNSSDGSTLVNFISEIVNYVAVITSFLLTFSLSMMVDCLSSTTNLLRTGFCFILNKKLQKDLKYTYNYGTERLEAMSMLFCDGLLVLGSLLVGGFAVYRIFQPQNVSDLIIVAVIFKVICVLVDLVLLFINVMAYRKSRTKIAQTSMEGMLAATLFDTGILLSVFLAMLLKNWEGVYLVEPVISVLISAVTSIRAIKRIKMAIHEITDLTLDEASQFKILRIINLHFNRYERMNSVNSRRIGDRVFIDLDLGFREDMTYDEIQKFLREITADLTEEFPNNKVCLTISNQDPY